MPGVYGNYCGMDEYNYGYTNQQCQWHVPTPIVYNGADNRQMPTSYPADSNSEHKLGCNRKVATIPRDQLGRLDEDSDTFIHIAISQGDVFMIGAFINRFKRDGILKDFINHQNKLNQTMLLLAVHQNLPQIVKLLVENCADPNIEGNSRVPPIIMASTKGLAWQETLHCLLQSCTLEKDKSGVTGLSALHEAIKVHGTTLARGTGEPIDSRYIVQTLLMAGLTPNKPDSRSGRTPIHFLVEKRDLGFIECVFTWMQHYFGKDRTAHFINTVDWQKNSPLHLVAGRTQRQADVNMRAFHQNLIKLLLNLGADVTLKNDNYKSAKELMSTDLQYQLGLGRGAQKAQRHL